MQGMRHVSKPASCLSCCAYFVMQLFKIQNQSQNEVAPVGCSCGWWINYTHMLCVRLSQDMGVSVVELRVLLLHLVLPAG